MTEKIKNFLNSFLQSLPSIVLLVVPIFFLPNTFDPFAFNKFYLINLIASLAILAWASKNIIDNKISITLSPATTGIFFLTLIHLISAYFVSPTKVLSFTGITSLFSSLFLIHLAYTSTKPNQKNIDLAKHSLVISSLIVSLFTILHYFKITDNFTNLSLFNSKYTNLTGGILSAVSFTIPVIIGLVFETIQTTENFKKITNLLVTSVLVTATTINIIYLFPKNSPSNLAVLPLNTSWAIALDIFKYPATAFIGTGPENYLSSFTRLRPTYLNQNDRLWNIRFSESGSLLLTIITTTGLLGGIFFIYPFLKSLQPLFSKQKPTNKTELFFQYSLLGFFIAFFICPVGITGIVVSFILLSLLTQIAQKNDDQKIKLLQLNLSTDDHKSSGLSKFLPTGILIVTIAILSTYWNFGSKFYLASTKINQANKIAKEDLNESFKKQVDAQILNPYDSTYSMVLSKTYQQIALYYLQSKSPTEQDKKNSIEMMQRSIDSARTAAQVDPFNVLVWENLSSIYQSFIGVADGATNLAISHLAQAISLDPTNPKLRLQLGILYYNLQDKEQAIKLINQASELKPNWSLPYQNLYRIYYQENDLKRAKTYLQESLKYLDNNSEESQKLQEELVNLNKDLQ